MNPKDIAAFAEEYLTDYLNVFLRTLTKPVAAYPATAIPTGVSVIGASGSPDRRGLRLSPKLISFMAISILIGQLLLRVAGTAEVPVPAGLTLTFGVWIIFASLIHLICRALKGRAGYWDTVSIALQLLPVIYVVSAFASLVGKAFLADDLNAGENVLAIFFLTQFILFAVYLPLALKQPHRLSWLKVIALDLIGPPLLMIIGIGVFLKLFWVPMGG